MKQLLARLFFRLSLRLVGFKYPEERLAFYAAWILALKVVHADPEVKEAALKK